MGKKKLTPREEEIYLLLMRGLTFAEISGIIYVATSTVKTHCDHICDKMLVDTRTQLMAQRIEELELEIIELKKALNGNTQA